MSGFSRVAGVHVVIVCQPGGWSACGYCVSAGWLELQGAYFPHVDGVRFFLNNHFHTDES